MRLCAGYGVTLLQLGMLQVGRKSQDERVGSGPG